MRRRFRPPTAAQAVKGAGLTPRPGRSGTGRPTLHGDAACMAQPAACRAGAPVPCSARQRAAGHLAAQKDNGDGGLMPMAELKPLLRLARRHGVSCAVAMTKAKQGVILLHRRMKPKKLREEMKRQAKAAGGSVSV